MAILLDDKEQIRGDNLTIKGYIETGDLERLVYDKLKSKGISKKSYPINPFDLIASENIILSETTFDNDSIRGMIVHGENASGILINTNRSLYSKRFIAMHELSHHWFHPRNTKILCIDEYIAKKKGIEWQANNAAAYALMPSELVIEVCDYCYGDIDYMCEFFKIGKGSMTYRLQELKLNKKYSRKLHYEADVDETFNMLENYYLFGGL